LKVLIYGDYRKKEEKRRVKSRWAKKSVSQTFGRKDKYWALEGAFYLSDKKNTRNREIKAGTQGKRVGQK